MIGKLARIAYRFGSQIKHLETKAVATQTGLKVTYPNQKNATHDIQNPLQTFISSLAACETATIRGIAKRNKFKLGSITWNRIQSSYDLALWAGSGGKDNKIGDITLDAQIQADLSQSEFEKVKQQTENLCPIYQIVTGGGVKIKSNWKLKKIS